MLLDQASEFCAPSCSHLHSCLNKWILKTRFLTSGWSSQASIHERLCIYTAVSQSANELCHVCFMTGGTASRLLHSKLRALDKYT